MLAFGEKYECPLGHYCQAGVNFSPVPCIAGSYLDDRDTGNEQLSLEQVFLGTTRVASDITDCSFCPAGYLCAEGTGDRYATPCPPGSICPAGSGLPILCPPGWYCEGTCSGCKEQEECPEGYYCPAGTVEPFACGADDVCPRKSAGPGTRGMTRDDCEKGTYLLVDKCVPCEPGFVCDDKTAQKYPIDFFTEGGYACPPGHYCPRGTTSDTIKKCPVGTHRIDWKGKSVDDCSPCPEGSS